MSNLKLFCETLEILLVTHYQYILSLGLIKSGLTFYVLHPTNLTSPSNQIQKMF